MIWIAAAMAALLVLATGTAATAGVIDDAKASILRHLFVPGSAKFSDLHKHGDYICGKVEAKTLEGAYTDAKVMMYNTKTQLSTIVDGSGISMDMTDTMKTDLDHACTPP